MPVSSHPLRVFISYAREDISMVEELDRLLKASGLLPVWDRKISPGLEFTDEIKRLIATAHVFLPLLTPRSAAKCWVQQEIGFASGIDLPVLPVCLDVLPMGMTAGIQAIRLQGNLSRLPEQLEERRLAELVAAVGARPELQRLTISSQVADHPGKRTQLLLEYARGLPPGCFVRQRAIFSSFSLPKGGPNDPGWQSMKQGDYANDEYRDLWSQERQLFEKQAREAGCALILNPIINPMPGGAKVHRTQLTVLLDFLKSMPCEKVTVAIAEAGIAGNLVLLGDWMVAVAVPPLPGAQYRGTFFTQHACTVLRYLRGFDEELNSHLANACIKPHQSRDFAIMRLEARLRELPYE